MSTQLKDIVNPDIKLKNKFSVLENKQVEAGEFSATPNQNTEEDQNTEEGQVPKKKKAKSKSKKTKKD